MYDVIIIGGGPAGLSAAMVLGRCRRKVVLFDTGEPRNRWSDAMNGFITRDGISPTEFIKIGRKELAKYDVNLQNVEITKVGYSSDGFIAVCANGNTYSSRKMLLATGLKDKVPDIPGIAEMYGKSVHHCPYCDGWESKDKPLAAYGKNSDGFGLALSLKTWSKDVMLFTDGTNRLSGPQLSQLERNQIKVNLNKIERLEGKGSQLQRIVLADGSSEAREAMFFSTGAEQQSTIGEMLGCEFTSKGVINTKKLQKTNIRGLFVAGDSAKDVQLVIVAAAEGTKAAVAINMELQEENRL